MTPLELFFSLSWLSQLIVGLMVIAFVALLVFILVNIIYTLRMPPVWSAGENSYINTITNERETFPSVFDDASLYLSIVIPAYNETKRLPKMMAETLGYLEGRAARDETFTYEIIIVDDGSKDNTTELALTYAKQHPDTVHVLTLQRNRGKGGAVRRGMLCSRGRYILMVDADGATQFDELASLERDAKECEKKGLSIAIGSRHHLREKESERRPFLRDMLMRGFHLFVVICGVRGIKDTQCGFKLFSRRAASLLLPNLHIERWAFDVELLFNAQRLNIPIAETDVRWEEVAGSTLEPMSATIQMAKDIFRIKLLYMFGVWGLSSETRPRLLSFLEQDDKKLV